MVILAEFCSTGGPALLVLEGNRIAIRPAKQDAETETWLAAYGEHEAAFEAACAYERQRTIGDSEP